MRRRLNGNWVLAALCVSFLGVGCAKTTRSLEAWLGADAGTDGGRVNAGMGDDDADRPNRPGMDEDSGADPADDDTPPRPRPDDDVEPEVPGDDDVSDDDVADDDVPADDDVADDDVEPEPSVDSGGAPPAEDGGVLPEPDADGGLVEPDVDAGLPSCTPVAATEVMCGDRVDDDCDLRLDCEDPDCRLDLSCCVASAATETSCDNAGDEDCDGAVDCADPDCSADVSCQPVCVPVMSTEGNCRDTLDDDCDTLIDCADADCATASECLPACVPLGQAEVNCADALDGDCDGFVDCGDSDCAADGACQPACVPATENCTDGGDNDCDTFVDCADGDCAAGPACCTPSGPEICTDGVDNDCNGVIDCPVIVSTVPERPPAGREAWEGGAVAASAARITLQTPARPTYVVQCRSGKPTVVSTQVFVACNPQDPMNLVVQPFPESEGNNPTHNGLMTTEVRFAYPNGQVSQPTSFRYYVHNSMAGVQPCPRKAPDQNFLDFARPYLVTMGSPVFTDADAKLAAPFVNIAFQPKLSSVFTVSAGQGNVEYLSLRRRFSLNAQKDLILVRRTFASRRATSRPCLTAMIRKHDSDLGPVGTENNNRYFRTGCDAMVVNKEGAGLCLVADANGVVSIANPQSMGWEYWNVFHGWVNWPEADNFVWRKLDQSNVFSPKCYQGGASCAGSNTDILFLPDRGLFAW